MYYFKNQEGKLLSECITLLAQKCLNTRTPANFTRTCHRSLWKLLGAPVVTTRIASKPSSHLSLPILPGTCHHPWHLPLPGWSWPYSIWYPVVVTKYRLYDQVLITLSDCTQGSPDHSVWGPQSRWSDNKPSVVVVRMTTTSRSTALQLGPYIISACKRLCSSSFDRLTSFP